MTRSILLVLALSLAACNSAEPSDVELEVAFPKLRFKRPLYFCQAPDGTNRAFVAEQPGRIRVFPLDREAPAAAVFLEIDVLRDGNEEGLLGLAFHPKYSENGFFYIYYSADDPRRSVISRFRVSDDSERADPDSETILLAVEEPYENHNGGALEFGPDGFLYIGIGDGGSQHDPHGNGQDLESLLAKILRIDVDRADGERPYGIPRDNPFVGKRGARPEIWAYGLRNPWRISFDRKTGAVLAGDVGQDDLEEVDLIVKGGNYGWRAYEGSRTHDSRTRISGKHMGPIAEYDHDEGQSITGGYVYRGEACPSLAGRYVYADYASGRLWSFAFDGERARDVRVLMDSDLEISSFGEDRDGELYATSFDGRVYRFVER